MEQRNELYPVFLKTDQLNILIVGGGKVGHEKLHFLLKSSPRARVEVLAEEFLPETEALARKHGLKLTRDSYSKKFLELIQIQNQVLVLGIQAKPESFLHYQSK